jgi:hypothetical protein
MRAGAVLLCVTLSTAVTAGKPATLAAGIYSNEEQVYFDKEAKRPAPPWISINVITEKGRNQISIIDAFARPIGGPVALNQLTPISQNRAMLRLANGMVTELRRARPVTCWVAVRKDKPKLDSSEDWLFQRGVKLHDQGGRAIVGGGDTGAQPVLIRLRNVTWDKGSTNSPVISFYVHKPDNPDHAESYSWAAPDSARIGINLRWMQSGCAFDQAGPASQVNSKNFRG